MDCETGPGSLGAIVKTAFPDEIEHNAMNDLRENFFEGDDTRRTRSFFASSVREFSAIPTETIVGQLAIRIGLEHAGDEAQQIRAWRQQVDILKVAFHAIGARTDKWGILLELPLLRLGRRIDTVIVTGDRILCLEFKIGADRYNTADINQAVDYALCLRDFHGASHGKEIIPILCASRAPFKALPRVLDIVDDVSVCLCANAEALANALDISASSSANPVIDWLAYDSSQYNPTPDIVTAARSIYAGHTVRDIGRADASAHALELTATELRRITELAREHGEHAICFVTGEPGSGKTLLGLDLVFSGDAGRVAGEPAALLSGNRPLVFVLQEAIALDARERTGIRADEARRRSQQALQTLLGYLKDHDNADSPPPEHVIVFDEAQRAWDADTGLKLLGRQKSEPELFLEIMGRLPWACLVCLVGPGQEINRGEGGLGLWGEALQSLDSKWSAYASPSALRGTRGVTGLLDHVPSPNFPIVQVEGLHLRTNLRAYRNDAHGRWVEAFLAGEIDVAASIAEKMEHAPAVITRDLDALRQWLHVRQRGEQRVGLLASSGAVRLISEGIPASPKSNELADVVHWFLRPPGDYRSSNALEVPLSEFVCQGLEVDYVGLCWGNDLIWGDEEWVPRQMRAPNWQISRKEEARQYRLNAYRVLLTRARAGLAIFVPEGNDMDGTYTRNDFDGVFEVLQKAGAKLLPTSHD